MVESSYSYRHSYSWIYFDGFACKTGHVVRRKPSIEMKTESKLDYIIELAEGGPWLKNDLTWTPDWAERGIWPDIQSAELARDRSFEEQ